MNANGMMSAFWRPRLHKMIPAAIGISLLALPGTWMIAKVSEARNGALGDNHLKPQTDCVGGRQLP